MASSDGKKSSNQWDLSNWSAGPVGFFQALGLKWKVQFPKLTPQLGVQSAAAAESHAGNVKKIPEKPVAVGNCNSAQTTANQKLGKQLAGQYGWGSGSEWEALNAVVMSESGWCNTIKNPSSSAYGIGQFLDATWATVGGTKTNDPKTQIELMLKYIRGRYKTPSGALKFHLAYGWY